MHDAKMIDVVIVAAGTGSRMNRKYKQFLEIAGKPLVYYSVKQFMHYGVNNIFLVVPRNKIQYARNMVENENMDVVIVEGGNKRHDSVKNGFSRCSSDVILIHDGARPFITTQLIDSIVGSTEKTGVSAPGIPILDTLKLFSGDKILWTKSRKNLLKIQTPQGFRREILEKALSRSTDSNASDELSLVESINGTICWVQGDPMNIKITYPADIKLAEIIAKNWRDNENWDWI